MFYNDHKGLKHLNAAIMFLVISEKNEYMITSLTYSTDFSFCIHGTVCVEMYQLLSPAHAQKPTRSRKE